MVRQYWDTLVAAGVSAEEYPFELCWARYKFFALAGWLGIVMILSALKVGATLRTFLGDDPVPG